MRNFKIATVFFCLVSASILLSSAKSYGDGLPPVKGPVILTVSGKITNTNKDGKAEFDREGLESLGMTSFTTSTPWFKQPVKFEGVTIAKILEAVGGMKGEKISVTAINDYSADLPMEDVTKNNVLLAIKRDDKYMPVSDKGPLFVVYNFDSSEELKQKKYYSRSVWQLSKINVK